MVMKKKIVLSLKKKKVLDLMQAKFALRKKSQPHPPTHKSTDRPFGGCSIWMEYIRFALVSRDFGDHQRNFIHDACLHQGIF